MSQLYGMAMKETPPIVTVNPFAGLELPVIRPHEIDFLERDEAEALFARRGGSGHAGVPSSSSGLKSGCGPASYTGCKVTGWTGCAARSRSST